jgi:inhibitor of KinA sporulation pathway (predicted exonuclease)
MVEHSSSLFDYYVILDFEAICEKEQVPRPQEIIEFPSIIIDSKSSEAVSRF